MPAVLPQRSCTATGLLSTIRCMKRRVFCLTAILVLIAAAGLAAQGADTTATIVSPVGIPLDPRETLILFYSDACPHCHNQLRWMAGIEDDFPDIEFRRFEIQVSNDRENLAYFDAVMSAYDSNTRGWPRTVIGERVFIGFDRGMGEMSYNDQFAAWVGYRNQLYAALEELQAAQ